MFKEILLVTLICGCIHAGKIYNCREGEKVSSVLQCSNYFICKDGVLVEKRCPNGQLYDNYTEECLDEDEVECSDVLMSGMNLKKKSKENHDSKKSKESHESKASKHSHESKGSKNSHESKESKNSHESKESKNSHESKGSKSSHESKESKSSHESKESHESKGSKSSHESKESKSSHESKESHESKSSESSGSDEWSSETTNGPTTTDGITTTEQPCTTSDRPATHEEPSTWPPTETSQSPTTEAPTNPPTESTSKPTDPTDSCVGNCPSDNDRPVYLPHEDCSKFCQCDWGKAHVHDCPAGLHFDPMLDVCNYPWDAHCERA